MYTDAFKSRYAAESRAFATPLGRASQMRSAYANDLLAERTLLHGSAFRGTRSTSLLTRGPAVVGPEHHEISANKAGHHNEYEVKTIEHEPVTRIETVPVSKQVEMDVTHMETREVSKTIQIPMTKMEAR